MPTQEKGIHQVPGRKSCRAREPEQDIDRGVKVAQRTILSENEGITSPTVMQMD